MRVDFNSARFFVKTKVEGKGIPYEYRNYCRSQLG